MAWSSADERRGIAVSLESDLEGLTLGTAPSSNGAAPAPWVTIPEFPSGRELMAKRPSPPPANPIDTAAGSKNLYLETQYKLNRHEAVEPLRQAICHFRDNPRGMEHGNYGIYTQVHVQGYLFSKQGAACRISFSTERSPKVVDWRKCSRLTPGAMVALSPASDNFKKHCIVAVIAARPLLGGLIPDPDAGEDAKTPPRIDVFWADDTHAVIDPTSEMVMLEANEGYFEPTRYAMLGLQKAAASESRFDKYIVQGKCDAEVPAYLGELPQFAVPERNDLFDETQCQAFQRMASRELAIVQGPPGTGKTFVSIVALESYVATLEMLRLATGEPVAPVVVAAQTNHAVDQLLRHCMDIDQVTARFGGRTKDEVVRQRTLYELRQRTRARHLKPKGNHWMAKLIIKLRSILKNCFPKQLISAEYFYGVGLITKCQYESLVETGWEGEECDDLPDTLDGHMAAWLGKSIERDFPYTYSPPIGQLPADSANDSDNELEEVVQEDDERLAGEFEAIEVYWTSVIRDATGGEGAWYYQAARLLKTNQDLYAIRPQFRGEVYRYLRRQMIDKATQAFQELLQEYRVACREIKTERSISDAKLLQFEGVQVIGCTLTGLVKYREHFDAIKPRILLVEEAAEARESSVTSGLMPMPYLEHLVLVGDHQQLQPHVDLRYLGLPPYNLNISFFERLLRLGAPYSMLQVQRRMAPAIRAVVNAFYVQLKDHVSVTLERPPVPGMGNTKLWWFQHNWPHSRDEQQSSLNTEEAEMILGFVLYLVQNGTHPSQITVLTYYRGQVDLILGKLKRHPLLRARHPSREWFVRTVDGYQGEENDVVILSLVRSSGDNPQRHDPGFVQDENRAVVACSRAKRGFYVFGDARNLLAKDTQSWRTWQKVFDVFEDRTGFKLPVTCRQHDTITELCHPGDWISIAEGGCKLKCNQICPQGHLCHSTCHGIGHFCLLPCPKQLSCGHSCRCRCGETCECAIECTSRSGFAKTSRPRRQPPPRSLGKPQRGGCSHAKASAPGQSSANKSQSRKRRRVLANNPSKKKDLRDQIRESPPVGLPPGRGAAPSSTSMLVQAAAATGAAYMSSEALMNTSYYSTGAQQNRVDGRIGALDRRFAVPPEHMPSSASQSSSERNNENLIELEEGEGQADSDKSSLSSLAWSSHSLLDETHPEQSTCRQPALGVLIEID